jgi:radical SAM superfamily enzyme YgiQ (UPF0313 family)
MPSCPVNVLMLFPRFTAASFWDNRSAAELTGARMIQPPLGLLTVAAMLPKHWHVRLLDRNLVSPTDADFSWADLVMTGGMLPQQDDTLEVVRLGQAWGKPVVVGGPDATSSPHRYEHADFLVLGEAESVIDAFIAAWETGDRRGVFKAEPFTADVTRSPIPRFDLVDFSDYVRIGVQFSRGCPFNCEFCDIIELYGRVPRAKTTGQVVAELDALYDLGFRGRVDFVDDNLVGNKKALRALLPVLVTWQRERGYPFEFSTEASINVAADGPVLSLLRAANFTWVFVGIESPDTDTLVGAQKKQNTRRDIVESVRAIYDNGISITAGFIVGFDQEQGSVAEPMVQFIEEAAIPICMVGLLYALPNTQLTRRLTAEHRLFGGHEAATKNEAIKDQTVSGLNFETRRPRRDMLADYLTILQRIYAPPAFFARVRRFGRALGTGTSENPAGSSGSSRASGGLLRFLSRLTLTERKEALRLVRQVARHPTWLIPFWRTIADCAWHNPTALKAVFSAVAMYLHAGPFSLQVTGIVKAQIAAIDAGLWQRPPLVPAAPPVHTQ